jgi:predicted nucleic acid-binding protein
MTTVVDASVVVAALVDDDEVGSWARDVLDDGALFAPHHMPSEVVNALRRHSSDGRVPDPLGALALDELTQLTVDLVPFLPFSGRIWALRQSVSVRDAWYVAVAETLEAPLATLDRRLMRANGPTCEFLTP